MKRNLLEVSIAVAVTVALAVAYDYSKFERTVVFILLAILLCLHDIRGKKK